MRKVILNKAFWLEMGWVSSWGKKERKGLAAQITEEFNLYQKHETKNASSPAGSPRTCWYGLARQMIRQDPGWWLLQVVIREDHNRGYLAIPIFVRRDNEHNALVSGVQADSRSCLSGRRSAA